MIKNNKRLGFEIKFSSSPKLSKSMQVVMENLSLDKFIVITGKLIIP